jgi:hypothetical protein
MPLAAALAPGSFVAINHSTSAVSGAAMEEAVGALEPGRHAVDDLAHPEQIARFFDGLDLVAPGVVSCSRWRPGIPPANSSWAGQPAEVDEFAGVAPKP